MITTAQNIGIKPAAREFGTTHQTVRLWLRRFQGEGLDGLLDKSRKPKRSPRQIPQADEERIVALRRRRRNRIGCWGIKHVLGLPYSTSTIYRVLKSHPGLLGKRVRKHQKKRNLREIKDRLRPFEKIQVDVKYLDDIPNYYEHYLRHKLPRFEFTARDERTGAVFISFARENTNINAASFITYVLEHLQRHNITVAEVVVQTDNGTEFVGPWSAKSDSLFTRMVQQAYGATHVRIPRGRPNVNADVESFHNIIENHFFDLESFGDQNDFLNKAYTYELAFNLMRPNSYRQGKTPLKILAESNCQIDPAVLSLPPVILDYHSLLYLRKLDPSVEVERHQKIASRVYYLSDSPEFTVAGALSTQQRCRRPAGIFRSGPLPPCGSAAERSPLRAFGTRPAPRSSRPGSR
jgi:transposase